MRKATCHPDRRHHAKGLCKRCYENSKPKKNLKYLYGITADDFYVMLAKQGGLCAICRTAAATNVDHHHGRHVVRALLCGACNLGLGYFRDDPVRLVSAARYVRKHDRPKRKTHQRAPRSGSVQERSHRQRTPPLRQRNG